MKKLIIILIGCLFMVGLNAQTYKARRGSANYFSYTGVAGDTIAGTTAGNFDFLINMNEPYLFDAQFSWDTLLVVGSNPDVTFQLQGSNDDVNYYNIGNAIVWTGDSDTTIRFTNLTETTKVDSASTSINYVRTENAVMWRYIRLVATGEANSRYKLDKAVFAILPKRY